MITLSLCEAFGLEDLLLHSYFSQDLSLHSYSSQDLSLHSHSSQDLFLHSHSSQVGLIDPGHFRTLEEAIIGPTKGRASIEVLTLKEMTDTGDSALT